MLSRQQFIDFTNKKGNWKKNELKIICSSLKLNTNGNKKQLYSSIKNYYNIKEYQLLSDWNVHDLKIYLKKRGLSTNGTKKILFNKMINLKKKIGGKKPSYSVVSYQAQGRRHYMEDRIIIKMNKTNCFFSILDGHGGSSCADFMKKNLYPIFLMERKKFKNNIQKSLLNTYINADNLFLKQNLKSGSTACSLFINNNTKKFYVANTGDSRIILYANNKIIQLSIDHKPSIPKEQHRIYRNGGFIKNNRLNGILAMTRSLGDINLKNKGLICYPDIITSKITQNIKYFVIASDGLYDVMTNSQIINFINQQLNRGIRKSTIVKNLIEYAIIDKQSSDNVSAIIIFKN
jgi:serine/threonine protein phosphatase PrpC